MLKLLSGALRTMDTDQYLYCDLTHLMWAGSPNEDMTSLIRNGQRRYFDPGSIAVKVLCRQWMEGRTRYLNQLSQQTFLCRIHYQKNHSDMQILNL